MGVCVWVGEGCGCVCVGEWGVCVGGVGCVCGGGGGVCVCVFLLFLSSPKIFQSSGFGKLL